MFEQFKLARPGQKRDSQPALSGPEANSLAVNVPLEDAVIVSNRAVRVESALGFPVKFVAVSNLADTTHHHLGRQAGGFTDRIVSQLVKFELVKRFCFPGDLADLVTSIISFFQSFKQGLVLFRGGLQFGFGREFHKSMIAHTQIFEKLTEQKMEQQNRIIELRSTKGAAYNLNYHLVWCPKYRRKILTGLIASRLSELFKEIAEKWQVQIIAQGVMPDHVHLFVSAPPRYSPAKLAQLFKGTTSYVLHLEFPEVKKVIYKAGTLWSPGYYVGAKSQDIAYRFLGQFTTRRVATHR